MELNFPDKVGDIYKMSPEVFTDYIIKYYIQPNRSSTKNYNCANNMNTDYDYLVNNFRYVYEYAKNLDDTHPFKMYALSICHNAQSRFYIYDQMPSMLKNSGNKIFKARIIFYINDCVDHIINLYNRTSESFSHFENIDYKTELFNLCIDDYTMSVIKYVMDDNLSMEEFLKSKQRNDIINNIIQ